MLINLKLLQDTENNSIFNADKQLIKKFIQIAFVKYLFKKYSNIIKIS